MLVKKATVTFRGMPGVMVPHGALLRMVVDGKQTIFVVHWAWWRRLLFWLRFDEVALRIGEDGYAHLQAEEFRC